MLIVVILRQYHMEDEMKSVQLIIYIGYNEFAIPYADLPLYYFAVVRS